MAEEHSAKKKKTGPALTFGGINENNIEQLRLLNDVTFPVKYNDKFYNSILATPPEFTKYGECAPVVSYDTHAILYYMFCLVLQLTGTASWLVRYAVAWSHGRGKRSGGLFTGACVQNR